MTSKKPPDSPDKTDWDAVTEKARKVLASTKDGADIEQQWNQWNERKRKEETADLKRAQRELLRSIGLPADALEMIEKGEVTGTPAFEAQQGPPVDILVISGGVGTGKTIAAVAWIHAWAMDKRNWHFADAGPQAMGRCVFTTAPALQRGPRFEAKWVERLMRASRLVVDDLGAEYVDKTGVFNTLLQDVVIERYAQRRPTLITTNLTGEGFKERYEARIIDRIRERGRFRNVGNTSMRGAKR